MTNGIVVNKSRIKGKGAYAARDFKKGAVVIHWTTKEKIKKEDVRKLSADDRNHITYCGNSEYMIMKNPERFVNHSCSPNTYTKKGNDVALRNIKKGEEITSDYSMNGFENWKMKCRCGSKNCRKIVYGDFRKLDKETKRKKGKYLESWFKKEIGV